MMTELEKGVTLGSPGLHAFLLVFPVDTFTEQDMDVVSLFKEAFGEDVMRYTIVLFTHGDKLEHVSIEQLIGQNEELSKLTEECGGRFHLLNNKDQSNREQVTELLEKIEGLVSENENSCYTLQMFKDQSERRYLQSFMKPEYLFSVVTVFVMGWIHMRNEGSFDVNTFLHGCIGGMLAAVVGAASGHIWIHIWKIGRITKKRWKRITVPGVMFSFGVGVVSGFFLAPGGVAATLLKGLQGSVVAYITMCRYSFRHF